MFSMLNRNEVIKCDPVRILNSDFSVLKFVKCECVIIRRGGLTIELCIEADASYADAPVIWGMFLL